MHQLWGIGLVLLSSTAFGAMAIFAQGAYGSGAGVTTVLFLRFGIAAIALQLLARLQGLALPQGRTFWQLLAIGGLGYGLQSFCFFTTLTLVPPGLAGLLLYVYPTLVMVISLLLGQESLTRGKVLALALASGGVVLTAGLTPGGQPLGIVFGLMSALIYACYVLVGSRVMATEDPVPACAVMLSGTAIAFGLVLGLQGPQWPSSGVGWLAVVAIALVSTVIAVVTLFMGVRAIGAINASTLSTWEPMVTILLAALFLQQPITLSQALGGSLILGSVIILARQQTTPG
ncbi:DMT family transporter [Prochlorothrix hollandica]|uniref:DMT family transporter n=1 Tax=Prochlorothrix hollandica TaxID=1223 RepID=UPI00333E25EB